MRYIFCTHSEKAVPLHRNSAKWGAERITNNQKNKCMKKLLIFALCLLGICNAHAEMMTAQEIILTELYQMQPWDSQYDDKIVLPNDGNSVRASINGDQLSIDAGADEHAYVEVIDPETGGVIADEEFVGEITMSITDDGDYELYIYTESGIVLSGEFEVK